MVDQARWQSGYAAACKAADAGSIPTLASNQLTHGPGGGIGRRYGLKIRCPKGRAGSSPAPGTTKNRNGERLERAKKKRVVNPLRPDDEPIDIDELYGKSKVCVACHK